MTDLEKFIALYREFGIDLSPYVTTRDGCSVVTMSVYVSEARWPKFSGDRGVKQFEGYSGFCSEVVFDSTGKFSKQEFWE